MNEFEYSAMISHASEDAADADRLCRALESEDLRCWIAPRDVTPGADFSEEIVLGIERAATMVVLVSRHSNVSKHVLREVNLAVERGRPIFPLFLEDVRLSKALDYYIATIHWLHARSGPIEQHAATLKKAIRREADWTAETSAPAWSRTVRLRPVSAFAVPFGASLLAGIALLAVVWMVQHREREVTQAAVDQSPDALGYVALHSARPQAGGAEGSVQLSGAVFLFAPNVPYRDVTVSLSTLTAEGKAIRAAAPLNTAQVGGAQSFTLQVAGVGERVVACLSLPHPRLQGRYRVTESFAVQRPPANTASDVVPPSTFVRTSPPRVARDDGSPCD